MQGRLNSHARPAASRAAATRTPTAGSAAGSPSACGSSLLSVTLAEAPCQPSVHGHRDAPHRPADVLCTRPYSRSTDLLQTGHAHKAAAALTKLRRLGRAGILEEWSGYTSALFINRRTLALWTGTRG